jgi:hypothetical protein
MKRRWNGTGVWRVLEEVDHEEVTPVPFRWLITKY